MKYMITYTLRISEDLMEQLREVAEYNSRSVNKEIEFLIKQHIETFQKEHDEVIVIKDVGHINEIAHYLHTVPHEVLCSISKRVPRIYKEK